MVDGLWYDKCTVHTGNSDIKQWLTIKIFRKCTPFNQIDITIMFYSKYFSRYTQVGLVCNNKMLCHQHMRYLSERSVFSKTNFQFSPLNYERITYDSAWRRLLWNKAHVRLKNGIALIFEQFKTVLNKELTFKALSIF